QVDASFFASTRPGTPLRKVFANALETYAAVGYPDEWRLHHQGGPAGYEPREQLGVPGMDGVVRAGQTYAWNPSITGVKFEDTILVGASSNEVLTEISGWPVIEVESDGQRYKRPAILES
nr:aminopeptidase P family protein [Chloroflexota bacterium]